MMISKLIAFLFGEEKTYASGFVHGAAYVALVWLITAIKN